LVSDKTRRVSVCAAAKLFAKAVAMRLVARRSVFVRHNHYPHAVRPQSAAFARWLIDRYESLFDLVFVHSGAELGTRRGQPRRHYVPHPLYRKLPNVTQQPADESLPARYFVAFGRIAAYKNLESLMTSFPENETLVVCGEVGDAEYVRRLASLERPNLVFRPGYLSEEAAQALVMGAQAVVIAHASTSNIVSGTFFYALSLHRPVFAIRTPFLDWISPRLGPDVLTLADDMQQLCKLIEKSACRPLSEDSLHIVQQELGDEAVRAALEIAFLTAGATEHPDYSTPH
jgi:glycosyltransferase involved in cell wall biosynthesis